MDNIYELFKNDRNFRYRMVYELVKRGYVIHGTDSEFNRFDINKVKGGLRGKYGYGAYFTDAAYKCEEYGNNFVFCNINDFNIIDLDNSVDKNSNPFVTSRITNDIVRMAVDYLQKNDNITYLQLNYYLSNHARGWEDASQDVSEMYLQLGYDGFKCGSEIVLFNFIKLNKNIVKDKISLLNDVYQQMKNTNESINKRIKSPIRECIRKMLIETLTKSYTGRLGNEFGNYQHAKNNSFWDKIEELGFNHKLTANEYDGKWNWKMRYYTINKSLMTNEVMQKLQQYLNFYNFVIIKKEEFEHTYKFCFEAKYGTEVKCADTYYHATPTEKVNKIMKVGLTPRDEGKRGEFRTPRVYLSPWYDDGLFSALYAEEGRFSSDRDYTVLKIDLSGMNHKPRVYRDEFATEQNCVYTYDNIPPQCLSIPPQKRKIEQAEENRVEKMFADSIGSKYGLETGKTIIKGTFEVPDKGYSVEVEIRFHMQNGVVYYPGDWVVQGFKKRFINTPKGKKYSNTYSFGKGYASPNYNGYYGKVKPIETAVKDLDKWLGNEFKPSCKSTQKVETIIREAVHNTLSEWINEVRYIDTRGEKYNGKVYKNHWSDIYNQEPITDDSRIRVFHGCELKTACDIAINGTSGRTYHPRQYSYESGMNPLGIFVTTDFETAKKFGVSNSGMAIIEFTAKGSELESPIWNGQGSYFGQGTNPMPFKNGAERNAQKMQYRQNALNTEDDYYYDDKHRRREISMNHVRNSDKPEMADRIFNNTEHQALFMGDLNPNMIKRIWVNLPGDNGYVHTSNAYRPMSVREFLKTFGNKEWIDYDYGRNRKYKIKKTRLFDPAENVNSFDDLIDRLYSKENNYFKTREEAAQCLKDQGMLQSPPSDYAYDTIKYELWPRQIIQLYGKDYFDKNFNKLKQ